MSIHASMSLFVCLALSACATSTPKTPVVADPAAFSVQRQVELERLFDLAASADAEIADRAATRIAELDVREAEFVAALWGRRSALESQARRIGLVYLARAEATPGEAVKARMWLMRALEAVVPADIVRAGELRYAIAESYFIAGDTRSALEVLANRVDDRPYPSELEARYRALLERIATTPASPRAP